MKGEGAVTTTKTTTRVGGGLENEIRKVSNR